MYRTPLIIPTTDDNIPEAVTDLADACLDYSGKHRIDTSASPELIKGVRHLFGLTFSFLGPLKVFGTLFYVEQFKLALSVVEGNNKSSIEYRVQCAITLEILNTGKSSAIAIVPIMTPITAIISG